MSYLILSKFLRELSHIYLLACKYSLVPRNWIRNPKKVGIWSRVGLLNKPMTQTQTYTQNLPKKQEPNNKFVGHK